MIDLARYIGDDEFSEMVNNDMKGLADTQVSEYLRSPAVLDRWHQHLLALKRNVEAQFVQAEADKLAREAEFDLSDIVPIVVVPEREDQPAVIVDMTETEYLAWQKKWKSGAVRFLTSVERSITEAKHLRQKVLYGKAPYHKWLNLKEAVMLHKVSLLNDDDADPAPYDLTLWKMVDDQEENTPADT